jgi:hypothetical protein
MEQLITGFAFVILAELQWMQKKYGLWLLFCFIGVANITIYFTAD